MNIILKIIVIYLFSFSVFAQGIVHHEMMVELIPEENEIKVIDKMRLTSFYENDKSDLKSLSFILYHGENVKVIEKGRQLKQESLFAAKKLFPNLIVKDNKLMADEIPVNVYSIDISKKPQQLTVEYSRKINHPGSSYNDMASAVGIISPEGVFISSESYWFPVFYDQYVTFNLSVRLPVGWQSVSQGTRLYSDDNKISHMDTWEENRPQNDIFIVAGKYTEYSKNAGNIKAMVFLRKADQALAEKYLETTSYYLDIYQKLIGDYPYTKFALVENFWETGYGMPSFTLLGPRIIRFPFILHSSYPHELLHNWWGNSVYIDYSRGNWSEGLTAYLADHLTKEHTGRGFEYRRTTLQEYTNFTRNGGDFALKDFITRYDELSSAVGYGKTTMLFHMLRRKVGDDTFQRALAQLYKQYRYKKINYTHIETVFSQVSGLNLSSFFHTWVNRIGAPDIVLENITTENKVDGNFTLKGQILQRQKESAYPINLPIAITLLHMNGELETKQLILDVQEKQFDFSFEFPAQPVDVRLDPELDVFRRLDISETPPALSQIFSASEVLIVLAEKESVEMKNAYEKLARQWIDKNVSIKYDSEMRTLPIKQAIWLIGKTNKFKSNFIEILSTYELKDDGTSISIKGDRLLYDDHSIILAGKIKTNKTVTNRVMGFISVDNPKAINGLVRKLPHYGKYSYLAFKGEAPTNFLKGQWPTEDTPLIAHLGKKRYQPKLQPRKSLIRP